MKLHLLVRYIAKNWIITTFVPFKVASGCINPPACHPGSKLEDFPPPLLMLRCFPARAAAQPWYIFCHVGWLNAPIFAMAIYTILWHTPRHMFISDVFTICFWPLQFKRQRMRDFMWRCLPLGNGKLQTNMDMKWEKKSNEMKWHDMKRNERKWNEMTWHDMKRHEMKWNKW